MEGKRVSLFCCAVAKNPVTINILLMPSPLLEIISLLFLIVHFLIVYIRVVCVSVQQTYPIAPELQQHI